MGECKYFHARVGHPVGTRKKKTDRKSRFLPGSAPDPGAVFGDPPEKMKNR